MDHQPRRSAILGFAAAKTTPHPLLHARLRAVQSGRAYNIPFASCGTDHSKVLRAIQGQRLHGKGASRALWRQSLAHGCDFNGRWTGHPHHDHEQVSPAVLTAAGIRRESLRASSPTTAITNDRSESRLRGLSIARERSRQQFRAGHSTRRRIRRLGSSSATARRPDGIPITCRHSLPTCAASPDPITAFSLGSASHRQSICYAGSRGLRPTHRAQLSATRADQQSLRRAYKHSARPEPNDIERGTPIYTRCNVCVSTTTPHTASAAGYPPTTSTAEHACCVTTTRNRRVAAAAATATGSASTKSSRSTATAPGFGRTLPGDTGHTQ